MTVPARLYKYTTSETAQIVLESGRLRWSSPNIFNDPAEFQRLPKFEPTIKEAILELPNLVIEAATGHSRIDLDRLYGPAKALYDLVKFGISNGMSPDEFIDPNAKEDRPLDQIYHERLREFFGENFTKQARVLCLTANPLNPAMWANYAQTHTGCLLGFKHIPELDTPFQEAKEVTYHSDAPCIGSGLDFLLYGAPRELRERTIDYICFSKKIDWQYEQEWRVITWRSNEGNALCGDYSFFPEELESITFGLKTSSDVISDITAVVSEKYPHCAIYRVQSLYGELQQVVA